MNIFKPIALVFCLFTINIVSGQIKVKDTNEEAVCYAHFYSQDFSLADIADSSGYVNIPTNQLNDTIFYIISSIGYKSDTLSGKTIKQIGIVRLKPINLLLNEIIISSETRQQRQRIVGNNKKDRVYKNRYRLDKGCEIAIKIEPDTVPCYLNNISYFIDEEGIPTSPFGVRVYNVDSVSGLPGGALVDSNIILSSSGGNQWVTFTFERPVLLPKFGLCVSMEWLLSSEEYRHEKTNQGATIVASGQALKASMRKAGDCMVYHRWFPITQWSGHDNFVPAIKCVLQY